MRIAIIADPEIPVPPLFYGGIERIINMLVTELAERNHEVSLFANSNSKTSGRLFPYKGLTSSGRMDFIKNALSINIELLKNQYDVVHSFGRLAYLTPFLPLKLPKLMSYQREPSLNQIRKAISISNKKTLYFTGCSNYISEQIKPYAPSCCIYNGVDLNVYDFNAYVDKTAPLVFIGRIEPIKGTHIAIEVAIKTKKKLIIAGNIPQEYQGYYDTQVAPFLNEQIKYIGQVNDQQKNILLGNALAFLMPIQWNEPFGIVMAEAMACGTPVIGFNRGSVPEVIINGVNGFSCNTTNEMIELIAQIEQLDRKKIRQDCEERFSSTVIVNQYLNLYQKLISTK